MRDTERFDRAAALLPSALRASALFLPEERKVRAEELRLRSGAGAFLRLPEGEVRLPGSVSASELGEAVEKITKSSFYAAEESLKYGYFTAEGGFRVGFCGSVIRKDGLCAGFRSVSSLCIRIPREVRCVDDEMLSALWGRSVLIFSRPGCGKTTFLRDLVRRLSDGRQTVALVDERGEVAALSGGVPQFDVGGCTDVLEGCLKTQAAEVLLRTMSPQVLAMDELGSEDLPILKRGAVSGVRLLATVHAASREELERKGIPLELFDVMVCIERNGGRRAYRLEEVSC